MITKTSSAASISCNISGVLKDDVGEVDVGDDIEESSKVLICLIIGFIIL